MLLSLCSHITGHRLTASNGSDTRPIFFSFYQTNPFHYLNSAVLLEMVSSATAQIHAFAFIYKFSLVALNIFRQRCFPTVSPATTMMRAVRFTTG